MQSGEGCSHRSRGSSTLCRRNRHTVIRYARGCRLQRLQMYVSGGCWQPAQASQPSRSHLGPSPFRRDLHRLACSDTRRVAHASPIPMVACYRGAVPSSRSRRRRAWQPAPVTRGAQSTRHQWLWTGSGQLWSVMCNRRCRARCLDAWFPVSLQLHVAPLPIPS